MGLFEGRTPGNGHGAGIGIGIVGREVEAREEVGGHIYLYAFYIAFVTVLVEGIAFQLVCLICGHLGELLLEHGKRCRVDVDVFLDDHIIDAVEVTRHAHQ